MKLAHDRLRTLIASIFQHAGCAADEAERIALHLVEANLVGHDSHGVIRVAPYVQWLRAGKVHANRRIQVVFENDAIAVVEGKAASARPSASRRRNLASRNAPVMGSPSSPCATRGTLAASAIGR
jgi:hydroxycarboxylate dehydrogenase B